MDAFKWASSSVTGQSMSIKKAYQSPSKWACIDIIGHPCQAWKHIRWQLSKLIKWNLHERFLIWILWNHLEYYSVKSLLIMLSLQIAICSLPVRRHVPKLLVLLFVCFWMFLAVCLIVGNKVFVWFAASLARWPFALEGQHTRAWRQLRMAMACSRDGADYLAMRWQYNGNVMAMMVMAKVAMACSSYSTD